jgi:ankyrin repeat protein
VVKAAATSGQEGVLKLINTRLNIFISKQWFTLAQFYNSAKAGDVKTIRSLLRQGIDPDLKNPRNISPLWRAAQSASLTVDKLLLDTQAVDLNAQSTAGRSPIFWAAANGHTRIVDLLLDRGANPSLPDENGRIRLSVAKENGHDDIVDVLRAML